jgi:hypothetical protein
MVGLQRPFGRTAIRSEGQYVEFREQYVSRVRRNIVIWLGKLLQKGEEAVEDSLDGCSAKLDKRGACNMENAVVWQGLGAISCAMGKLSVSS